MFVPKGHLAKNTFRYRVKRQKGKFNTGWANLMYKCDDGRWRKVKRYKTVNGAYGALMKKTGHKIDVEKIFAKLG